MATTQQKKIELLVSYFIRIHIHSKYSHLHVPSEIHQLIEQFAKKCIGSKLLTNDEEQEFIKFLLTHKTTLFERKGFKLLYTASENQYLAKKFHKFCDNKGPTMVIIESEFGAIFGGYTSKSWKSPEKDAHITDVTAFLFLIRRTDKIEYEPQIFDVQSASRRSAIVHVRDCGPVFGNGYSLKITDKCDIEVDTSDKMKSSYSWEGAYKGAGNICGNLVNQRGGNFFRVIDYEVFQVQ